MKKFFWLHGIMILTIGSMTTEHAGAQKGGNNASYWDLGGNSNATSSSKLGTNNSVPLRLATKGLERLRIDTLGRVGIGVTDPESELHVAGKGIFTSGLKVVDYGVYVENNQGQSTGVEAKGLHYGVKGFGSLAGIRGETFTNGGYGMVGNAPFNEYGQGWYGNIGVYGEGWIGSMGFTGDGIGVFGKALDNGYGLAAYAMHNAAIYARSDGYTAVYGVTHGSTGYGGEFYSDNSHGIFAEGGENKFAGFFNGPIYATNLYITSDQKLKKNVRKIENATDLINRLQPKMYEFRNDEGYSKLDLPRGEHFGLLAQDVEQLLPNLIKESGVTLDKNLNVPVIEGGTTANDNSKAEETVSFKAVNYIELIPILVKAIQEQQQQIDVLEKKLAAVSTTNAHEEIKNNRAVSLSQNIPNPANGRTQIAYNVPAGSVAQLLLTDGAGRNIKSVMLDNSGKFDLDITSLITGTYFYSLLVDGKTVDTKKLTIIR